MNFPCGLRPALRASIPSRIPSYPVGRRLSPGVGSCRPAHRRTSRQVCRLGGIEEYATLLRLDLDPAMTSSANCFEAAWSAPLVMAASSLYPLAYMASPVASIGEVKSQVWYLLIFLSLLIGAAYLVVRQALIRRELDESAKALGETIRTGEGTSEDYFELAAVLIRKKLFTQAIKNLEKSIALWQGDESEMAQVHNALGYCYFNTSKVKEAVKEYTKAVNLQPGYVTAWNNLGDAHESLRDFKEAFNCYKETLSLDPNNKIAQQRVDYLKLRIERLQL